MMSAAGRRKVPIARAKTPSRVLIVDNELLVRWSLAAGLRLAGFDAITAASSMEALVLARQPPHPDVVLIDAELYDGDPAALLEDLRHAAPRCRFVILTTEGREPPWREGIGVVTKPFDLADVIRRVGVAAPPAQALAGRHP